MNCPVETGDVETSVAEPFYVTSEAGFVVLALCLVAALFLGDTQFGKSDR